MTMIPRFTPTGYFVFIIKALLMRIIDNVWLYLLRCKKNTGKGFAELPFGENCRAIGKYGYCVGN